MAVAMVGMAVEIVGDDVGKAVVGLEVGLGDVGDDEMEDDAAAAPVAEARTQSDDHSKTRMTIAVTAGVVALAVIIYYLMV